MSRLFGPLSEMISKVSCRLCAFAAENTAGAATPAATAETDLRKSRRFMCRAPARMVSARDSARDVPDAGDALTQDLTCCFCCFFAAKNQPARYLPSRSILHTIGVLRPKLWAEWNVGVTASPPGFQPSCRARATSGTARDQRTRPPRSCLLYTSPSPRDS